jgi:hypothetical protein
MRPLGIELDLRSNSLEMWLMDDSKNGRQESHTDVTIESQFTIEYSWILGLHTTTLEVVVGVRESKGKSPV